MSNDRSRAAARSSWATSEHRQWSFGHRKRAPLTKTYGPPVCKGFCRDRRLISLLQRIRPRRSPPGQDGDTRAPVLINSSASCAVFNIRLPERRLTVRPSRRHPLANLACTTGAFAPTERILGGHGYRPGVKRFPALQRSSPACWPRRRPRHCDGSCSSALSPTGQAACRAPLYRAARRALHGSTVCADTCCRVC